MADHAVSFRAERGDCALAREVEVVGPQSDDRAAERLEGVREEEQLAARVHAGLLPISTRSIAGTMSW